MKCFLPVLAACLLACLPFPSLAAIAPEDLEPFIAESSIRDIKISPTGEYFAMTVPRDGQTGIMVMRRADRSIISTMRFTRDTHVADFWWVNNERILMSLAETFGTRDDPVLTGEMYGMNANGGRKELLAGWRAQGERTGTRIGKGKNKEGTFAVFLVDPLPDDDANVLVSVRPFSKDPFTRIERMNVYDGRRTSIASSPVAGADFVTDNRGQVRFTVGSLSDNYSQLFYRESDGAPWRQLNHERESRRVETPLGFSADDAVAYLRVSQPAGPDRIVAFDVRSGERTELPGDVVVDPSPIYRDGWGRPIGARYLGASTRMAFFDEDSDDARLLRTLQAAFPGHRVSIPSASKDGRLKVVLAESDVDPGSFYLFDTVAKNADFILARDDAIDVERMSPVKPVELVARDGTKLHGFVTSPAQAAGEPRPMVVMPHGGPFYVFDDGSFDKDAQLLAGAGYAVLQVNFRGSDNYGRAFRQAGARQWGGAMQDDLTDATHWAVREGLADKDRICIYGASYGAYAALMGVAREPELYRCAVGYVGVYDLQAYRKELSARGRSGETWANEWVGDDAARLAATSPNRQASGIKVPVFLAAGGEDFIAPVEHTRRMENALRQAGVPVETLYYPKEGHGFYEIAHRREFYVRLLGFLDRHIGAGRGSD